MIVSLGAKTYFASHGMPARNTTVQVDGMMMNSTRSDNQVNPYFNDAMNQEVSYQTPGIGAETSSGGASSSDVSSGIRVSSPIPTGDALVTRSKPRGSGVERRRR